MLSCKDKRKGRLARATTTLSKFQNFIINMVITFEKNYSYIGLPAQLNVSGRRTHNIVYGSFTQISVNIVQIVYPTLLFSQINGFLVNNSVTYP